MYIRTVRVHTDLFTAASLNESWSTAFASRAFVLKTESITLLALYQTAINQRCSSLTARNVVI